jgi:hypothetical protein
VFGDTRSRAASEKLNVDVYIGCYVTKPSAPALSHRIGARAAAMASDTAMPLRRCAKMCAAYECKIPTHPLDEPAHQINVNLTSIC